MAVCSTSGMLVGVCGLAAHAFHRSPAGSPGYAGSAIVARNCSAVTAACLMTRRAVFDEVGGLDEALPVDFNDVDFCLRLRARGYRIVFTPYAELVHHESASFGRRVQSAQELTLMRQRWGARSSRPVLQSESLEALQRLSSADLRCGVPPSLPFEPRATVVPCAVCGGTETRRLYTKFGYDIGRVRALRTGVRESPRAKETIVARYSRDYFWNEYLPALGVVDGRLRPDAVRRALCAAARIT